MASSSSKSKMVNHGNKPQQQQLRQQPPHDRPRPMTTTEAVLTQQSEMQPLFDWFYEEFLTQVTSNEKFAEEMPKEFMKIATDIDRVEYIMHMQTFVADFEISEKVGTKNLEKSNRIREEGNRLFQNDQAMQAILFYNKALTFAPHPNQQIYQRPDLYRYPPEPTSEEIEREQREAEVAAGRRGAGPDQRRVRKAPYEALSFCYANRSAALRKLGQYEDCLRDISRAARFGYPKESMYKLWERKGKCYQGLKKIEMAVKCYRMAIQSLKESSLNETQRGNKSGEIQSWIRELKTIYGYLNFGDDGGDGKDGDPGPMTMMGATGPIVFVPETESRFRKVSQMASVPETAAPPTAPSPQAQATLPAPAPDKPLRRSFRIKKNDKKPPEKQTSVPNGGGTRGSGTPIMGLEPDTGSADGSVSDLAATLNRTTTTNTPYDSLGSLQQQGGQQSPTTPTQPQAPPSGDLVKVNSQLSISQLSATSVKPEIEAPELSYGSNPRLPNASTALELRFTPEKGRHFAANQNLAPGDVVLREEPHAAVLEAIFRVNHCAYCLKKLATPIPCYECATVQYCSESCRDVSWKEYHRIECGILGYLEPSRYLGKMPHLALRIITKTGMQALIQHSLVSIPTVKNGAEGGGGGSTSAAEPRFDSNSYRAVHNLASNTDKRPFEDLVKKTCEAIFMAKCLKFNGFFGERDAATQNTRRAEIFVASLLLRHLQIASTNGLEMAECILKNNDVTKFDIIPVGGAIFPAMSFFNHSCYPNAIRIGYQNQQVVRVTRPILKGEEVNIDYGFDFYVHSVEQRQKRSQSQYFFTCNCIACTQSWPTYEQIASTRARRLRTGGQPPTQAMADELERQAAAYVIGMDFLLKLEISTALPIFRDYLMTMRNYVEHPDARYIDCEEAFKQCLWLENRGYKPNPPLGGATAAGGAGATASLSMSGPSYSVN